MTTVIIPAAGLASRLRPISNMTSKSMVPVNGKPTISYIIDQVKDYASDIRIVYGKSDDIVDYCKIAYNDLPISFYKQSFPHGPLHAAYCAMSEDDLGSEKDLIIWLGDTIVLDYMHDKGSSKTSVVYGQVQDWDRWCLIDSFGSIIDKPNTKPNTNRALVGIYAFPSLSDVYTKVNDIIKNENPSIKNEYQISQLLNLYNSIIQIETNEWYDCGDFPSLYSSRAKLLNRLSRSDNELDVNIDTGTIRKTGTRCYGEINWYNESPDKIKPFLPTIYSYDKEYSEWYNMEYCNGVSLQDTLVYENIKTDTIQYVMNKVISIHEDYIIKGSEVLKDDYFKQSSENMWIKKNLARFSKYEEQYPFINKDDLNLLIDYIESKEFNKLVDTNTTIDFIHGDLHLGNILFDFNTGKVKLIDPRGEWDGAIVVYGDIEYDLAKMYQSCFCEYMWIINKIPTNYILQDELVRILDNRYERYNIEKLKIMSSIMMASCLPFHNDDIINQKRIWETSIKKFKELLYK